MIRRKILLAGILMVVATSTGCHKHKNQLRGSTMAPMVLGSPQYEGLAMDSCTPTGKTSCVDRHPLLYKPKDVFRNTDHGPIVKTAAATFVGVPVGLAGEVGQVFHGCPRCAR